MPGDAVLHRDRAGGNEPVAVSVSGHKYPASEVFGAANWLPSAGMTFKAGRSLLTRPSIAGI